MWVGGTRGRQRNSDDFDLRAGAPSNDAASPFFISVCVFHICVSLVVYFCVVMLLFMHVHCSHACKSLSLSA